MSVTKRLGFFISAVALLSAAAALVVQLGLPNRANFTGQSLAGEYVAPEIGALAPPIRGTDIDDNPINMYQLRGEPVIVSFWATWCGPCRIEMPILQEIYEAYSNEGLTIIAVNLAESRPLVRQWVAQYNLTYSIVIDSDGHIQDLYNFYGPPSTFVVSPDGIITDIYYGPVSASSLHSAISQVLPES